MTPEPDLFIDQEGLYRLFRCGETSLCIGVLTGRVGMYEIVVELTPDEVREYERAGKAFLDHLARRIRRKEEYRDHSRST